MNSIRQMQSSGGAAGGGSSRGFSTMSLGEMKMGGSCSSGMAYQNRSLYNQSGTKRTTFASFPRAIISAAGGGSDSDDNVCQIGGRRAGGGPGIPVCPLGGIQKVSINQALLKPLYVEIDPNIQKVKTEEREQIKTLNNKFASFIDKVRFLEQQNKVLETKWHLLQEQGQKGGSQKPSLEPIFGAFISLLQRQLDSLLSDKGRLDSELNSMQDMVEDYKKRYESEINKRTAAEYEFEVFKKGVDGVFIIKSDLGVKVDTATDELNFLRTLYDTELQNAEGGGGGDTSVILSIDNNRDLNMDGLIKDMKKQYDAMAEMNRTTTQSALEASHELAEQQGDNLKNIKSELSELNRRIQRLRSQIENTKIQISALQASITEAENRGGPVLKDAKKKLIDLEAALQKTKEQLALQTRDYQVLLNVKIGRNVEICTYKALLNEGPRVCEKSSINSSRSILAFGGPSNGKSDVGAGGEFSGGAGGGFGGRAGGGFGGRAGGGFGGGAGGGFGGGAGGIYGHEAGGGFGGAARSIFSGGAGGGYGGGAGGGYGGGAGGGYGGGAGGRYGQSCGGGGYSTSTS